MYAVDMRKSRSAASHTNRQCSFIKIRLCGDVKSRCSIKLYTYTKWFIVKCQATENLISMLFNWI